MTKKMNIQSRGLLNLPLELRDEASLKLARGTTAIVMATVFVLIGWAAIAPVEEVAVASGKVVPASAIGDVHHFEGGIVDAVHVREGDRVKRGELLVSLRPEQAAGDLSQLDSRAANLTLKQMRLTAAIEGTELDFGAAGAGYPDLRSQHEHAFRQERSQAQEKEQELRLVAERIEKQRASARDEVESLSAQASLQSEQAEIREKSHARGYTSKHTLLQAQGILEQTRQKLVSTRGRVAELTKMLEEARAKLRETRAERLRRLSEDRTETAAQLSEAREALAKHRDRVRRLAVSSPIDGVVQSLTYKVDGEVIKPGALVAQIVPEDEGVIAEVELKPRDIGHVSVGNQAEIKLSNYDPNVVGVINGQVELISATTFEDKEGRPFYRVRIAMEKSRLEAGGKDLPISPGTTLNAQILTGSKTLLRYLLKPVYQSFDTAFSER